MWIFQNTCFPSHQILSNWLRNRDFHCSGQNNRLANMTLCMFSHKLKYCVAKFSNKKKKQFIPMAFLTPVVLCMIRENHHHQQHSNHHSTLHEGSHSSTSSSATFKSSKSNFAWEGPPTTELWQSRQALLLISTSLAVFWNLKTILYV